MRRYVFLVFIHLMVAFSFLGGIKDNVEAKELRRTGTDLQEVQTFQGERRDAEEATDEKLEKSVAQQDYGTFSVKAFTKNAYAGRYGYQSLVLEEQKKVYQLLEDAASAFQASDENGTVNVSGDAACVNGKISVTSGEVLIGDSLLQAGMKVSRIEENVSVPVGEKIEATGQVVSINEEVVVLKNATVSGESYKFVCEGTVTLNSAVVSGYYAFSVLLKDITIMESDVGYAIVAFIYDHPECFWSKGYSYFRRTDRTVSKISLQCQEEYIYGSERKRLWEEMETEIQQYMDLIVGVCSDYEKELILHDAIAEKITYAYENGSKNPESQRWAHSIEGVFSSKYYSAVCEGYAKAFQLLLNAAGIENVYVVGKAAQTGHAWNQVKIEGEWYNVDLTWNDTGNRLTHKYFNVKDSTFNTSHRAFSSTATATVGEWCYPINSCDSDANTYVTKGGYHQGVSYICGIGTVDGATVKVYNQGVEVASGCAVAENTLLEVVVYPDNKRDSLQITTSWGKEEHFYEGVVSSDGLSYQFSIQSDVQVNVQVKVPATYLSLGQKSMRLEGYGVKKKISSTLLPKKTTDYLVWESSKPKVATVKDGMVTAKSAGTTIVTARTQDGLLFERCTVKVVEPYIVVSSSKSSVKVGKKLQMKVTKHGCKGSVIWSVSNKKYAVIGRKSGKLTAKKSGKVTIKAKLGKITAKKKIEIKK